MSLNMAGLELFCSDFRFRFTNTVYIVAPPKQLEPGNTCLQQEMKAAKGNKGVNVPQKKTREVHGVQIQSVRGR